MSIYDRSLDAEVKEDIMELTMPSSHLEILKCAVVKDIKSIAEAKLNQFVTRNSFNLLGILGVTSGFSEKNPWEWFADQEYLIAEEIAHSLRVTNDTAERGVKLMHEYSSLLSYVT